MEKFEDDFRFFRDAIESIPGETDTVIQMKPQNLSRNDLQERLTAKINQAKSKNKQPKKDED